MEIILQSSFLMRHDLLKDHFKGHTRGPPLSSGSALASVAMVKGSILLWGKFHKNFSSLAQAFSGPI